MKIIRNDVEIELTQEELLAAFREQDRNYLLEDAERQYKEWLDDNDWDESSPADIDGFTRKFGFAPSAPYTAGNEHYMLDQFVERYSNGYDCNIAENDLWRNAIDDVMAQLLAKAANKTAPECYRDVLHIKPEKVVIKLYDDNKFKAAVNIPSVMWPLNSHYELFHCYNCSTIESQKVRDIVNAVPYQIGHCYSNTENIVTALKEAGYDVKSYCGWLFTAPGTYPIHHSWAVLDGCHVIDLADDNELLMANHERFAEATTSEERTAMMVDFTKWSLGYKHSDRCYPFGIPSRRFLYVGCPCDRVEGIHIYNQLCLNFPRHPCNEKVRYPNGMTRVQAALQKEGIGV